jgi:hypothetical protein
MSIGLGNIIVQNKKEPAGVSDAESGLHMDGSKARLGGQLLENTDIDIDTNTFFLQWDGAAGAFLIDVFNDKYFFGTIDGSFNLETGFTFKENEAAIKLNGNAAVSARGQAGIGAGIVYEIGDVENVNNGTKITITEDTETVEITNIPNVDFTNMPVLFLDGNKLVKGNKANFGWQNFDIEISDATNTSGETQEFAKFSIINNTCFFSFSISFLVSDDSQKVTFSISLSDIETIAGITFDNFDNFAFSSAYNIPITPYPINYINAAGNGAGGVAITISPATVSGSEISSNVIQITGFALITTV